MALQYVYQHDASLTRKPLAAGEVITEGEFVRFNGSGEIRQFDPSADDLPHAIIVHNPEGDSIVEHDEDYVSYSELWTYRGDEGDRAYVQPLDQVDQVIPETITDEADQYGATPPEPSINDGTVVGIIADPGTGETRIVESGYTYDMDDDGTAETVSESGTGNFVAIGRATHDTHESILGNEYDTRIPVRRDGDLFTPAVNV